MKELKLSNYTLQINIAQNQQRAKHLDVFIMNHEDTYDTYNMFLTQEEAEKLIEFLFEMTQEMSHARTLR